MDVKDYSQKLDQAREKYRTAQDDLRSSYDKTTSSMKENFDNKTIKQSKNYDAQKSKLEEQNLVNNELYSEKTKQTIADRQDAFRKDIKKNSEKFDIDRNVMKSEFSDKLSNLSDSYKKSTEENDRFHDQASKTMGERYLKANKNYKADFDGQVENLNTRVKENLAAEKIDAHKERQSKDKENQANLETLRSTGQEQKFKEVSRLKSENENLHISNTQERDLMQIQQEARISDILKLKNSESEEGQKNIASLQENIRHKNLMDEEKIKIAHQNESKELKKRFNEDLRNVQHLSDQKIKGGNEVTSLKDENKQLISSYENRLSSLKEDSKNIQDNNREKENVNDLNYRDKIRTIKQTNSEENDRHEVSLNSLHKKNFQELKDKNSSMIDRYKTEISIIKKEDEHKLANNDQKSKGQLKEQRVEFGKYINTVNSNNMEEISSIKNEYSKDKSNFIEKSKRDFSEEKLAMKEEFNHQISLKDEVFEKKLADMEKQTNKIIDNYEKRIAQVARKAENEVETLKVTDQQRKAKEDQAIKIAFESQEQQHQADLGNIRDKYEGIIGRDRILNEQQTNRIIQKYEDQRERESIASQKEMSMRVSESEAKYERLFKSSELEKETIRNQYDQRIENMKIANLKSDVNSKKA
jgi:hypothetical protein